MSRLCTCFPNYVPHSPFADQLMPGSLYYAQRILNGRTFRLLHIDPAIDQHQQLECTCRLYNIDNAPQYEALSYVWGSPTPSVEILCNGQSIAIAPELSYALKRLRLPDSERIIWADAICINQEDNPEKSHQVPLMGSIYSSAKRAVVWLGPGEVQHTRRAFDCCRRVAAACGLFDYFCGRDPGHSERHDELPLSERWFDLSAFSSLLELFNRPWFSRIWCIQEIRLAEDALVMWGDNEISWTDLSVSASWMFDRSGLRDYSDPVTSLLEDIPVENADMMSGKDMYRLLDALDHFRVGFQASNPRDKVYGLLNLVSSRFEVEALDVDYDKSVGRVYADTVLVDIQLRWRLTAFARITHPANYDGPGIEDFENPKDFKEKSDYRSWAPRWDRIEVAEKLGIDDADCPWSACGENSTAVIVAKPSEPAQLCLKGVIYGRVDEVGRIMDYYNLKDPEYAGDPKFDSDNENADEIVPDGTDINSGYDPTERHPYIDNFERIDVESSPEKFARTLTAGRWGLAGNYLELLSSKKQARHSAACIHLLLRLLHIQEFGEEGEYVNNADSLQFQTDAHHACEQRRIFWTDKKSYGLGPHCMRSGDVVVVLYGGNTPYILRPRGDGYIFMGQAYVDEIMHGEMFHDSEKFALQEQVFCLI